MYCYHMNSCTSRVSNTFPVMENPCTSKKGCSIHKIKDALYYLEKHTDKIIESFDTVKLSSVGWTSN